MEGKLTLRAVAAETNEPIEGVSIVYRSGRSDGKNRTTGTVTTGKDGMATIEYPTSFKTGYFEITARKPKLVPIYLLWDDKRHPLDLPTTKELRFEPGTTIGGVVKDEAGHPIEGATVGIHAPPTEYEGTHHVFSLGELKTDAQGRWRLDVAPRNLGEVWMSVEHPHYRRKGGTRVTRPRQCDRPHEGTDGDRAGRRCRGPAGKRSPGHHWPRHFWSRSSDRDDERAGRVHPGELRPRPDDHHGPGRGLRASDPGCPCRGSDRTR